MNNRLAKLDMNNLIKLAPLCLSIGIGLGGVWTIYYWIIDINLSGLWILILLAAWLISGGLYANTLLKSGLVAEYKNIALNGAILAAISEVVFNITAGIVDTFQRGESSTFFTISLFLEAFIIGGISAVAWYAYQVEQNGNKISESKKELTTKRTTSTNSRYYFFGLAGGGIILWVIFGIVFSNLPSPATPTPTSNPKLPWGEVFEGYAVPSEWFHMEFEDANNFEMLFGPLPECIIAGDYAGFPILDPHLNYDGVEGPETIYVLASDEMIPFFENKCAERLILRGEQWRTWNPTTGYDTIIMVVNQVLREGVDE